MSKSRFGLISDINVTNESSWRERSFLTVDIDWAHDEIIEDTIQLVESAGVPATWFMTHQTSKIDRLRANTQFQIGVHPNFNFLLDGSSTNQRSAGEVLKSILDIVPDAKILRSHSLMQSERLIDLFIKHGITHMSNNFTPMNRHSQIVPWNLWNSFTVVPHCWQDNVSLKMELLFPGSVDSVRQLIVYDFHPIHVFLNSENLERYESTRHLHQKPDELIKYRFDGEGIRTKLISLLNSTKLSLATEGTT